MADPSPAAGPPRGTTLVERLAAHTSAPAGHASAPLSDIASANPAVANPAVANPAASGADGPQPAGPSSAEHAAISVEKLRQNGLLVPGASSNALSEAFRIAKRHLLLNAFGGRATPALEHGRVVVLSSAQANEGKTFCAINLALSIASERAREVLLIDADCIKPEVLSRLGVGASQGLIDALLRGEDPSRHILRTSIPNLFLLPAGPRVANDAELLSSHEMQAFVQRQLAAHPDRILLFDTAPALVASQGPVLAAQAGQVVMVVRADVTRDVHLAAAIQLFGDTSRLQLLLNRATFQTDRQRYGAYYGYRP